MITIYSANACPFAQRARALLTHLGTDYKLEEIDLDNRDPEFLKMSPTGKVPFLVDGRVKLFESRVINDYLAEKLGFDGAYSDDLELRALQKLLMARWDEVIAPAFYGSLRDPQGFDAKAVRPELGWMAATVNRMKDDVENLAGFHAATHWARMDWLRDLTPLPGVIDEYPALRAWLDRAVAQPAVQQTLPDRDALVTRYRERFAAAQ